MKKFDWKKIESLFGDKFEKINGFEREYEDEASRVYRYDDYLPVTVEIKDNEVTFYFSYTAFYNDFCAKLKYANLYGPDNVDVISKAINKIHKKLWDMTEDEVRGESGAEEAAIYSTPLDELKANVNNVDLLMEYLKGSIKGIMDGALSDAGLEEIK